MAAELLGQLRIELAARSPCEAAACPSWDRGARWLREQGHTALAQWLELEMGGLHRKGDRGRLRAVIERALQSCDEQTQRAWRGELGWSLWLGPFVIAYIGPQQVREAFGVLGVLLADERAWVHGDRRLPEFESGVLLLDRTLPGTQPRIHEHLLGELRERVGELAHDGGALKLVDDDYFPFPLPPDPVEGWAVVSLESGETLQSLSWDHVRALEGVAAVGPPELLSRWPDPARREPCFAPLPNFEARYERLAAQHPALLGRLRAEIDERPLAEAHTCPSWLVYRDWLLDQGAELLAEWLRLDLDAHYGKPIRPREMDRLLDALAPLRPPEAAALRYLWTARDDPQKGGSGVRSFWLGPFMLAYVDPQLFGGFGADELQAMLGRHASLLPRSRVYTEIDRRWVEQALTPRRVPVLAPTPTAGVSSYGMVLRELYEDDGRLARRLRMASPGRTLVPQAERSFATNLGPIAADHEAIAVICCETDEDLRRHAKLWDHLQTFEHLVLVGTAEVLARWPHPGKWIEPWAQPGGRP